MPTRTAAAPKTSAPRPSARPSPPAPSPRRKTPSRAGAAAAPEPAPSPSSAPPQAQAPRAPQASQPPAKPPAKALPSKAQGKPPKLHRKPVRERVKLPEADVALIETLKARALAGGRPARKSELVRAGLQALAAMDTPTLVQCLKDLEPLKLPVIRWLE